MASGIQCESETHLKAAAASTQGKARPGHTFASSGSREACSLKKARCAGRSTTLRRRL